MEPSNPSLAPPPRRWLLFANPIGAFLRFVDRDGLIPTALVTIALAALGAAIFAPRLVHKTVADFREAAFRSQAAQQVGIGTTELSDARTILRQDAATAAHSLEGQIYPCVEVTEKRSMLLPANAAQLRAQAIAHQTCTYGWGRQCPCDDNADARPSCLQQVEQTRTTLTREIATCEVAARTAVTQRRTESQQILSRFEAALTAARARNDAPPQPWFVLVALALAGIVAFQVALYRLGGLADPELRGASKPRLVVYVLRTALEALVLGTPVVVVGTLVQVQRVEALRALVPFGTLGPGKLAALIAMSCGLLVVLHVVAMILGSLGDALVHAGQVVRLAAGAEVPLAVNSLNVGRPAPPATYPHVTARTGFVAVAVLTTMVCGAGVLSLAALAGLWSGPRSPVPPNSGVAASRTRGLDSSELQESNDRDALRDEERAERVREEQDRRRAAMEERMSVDNARAAALLEAQTNALNARAAALLAAQINVPVPPPVPPSPAESPAADVQAAEPAPMESPSDPPYRHRHRHRSHW
jgi:hypothetical protein